MIRFHAERREAARVARACPLQSWQAAGPRRRASGAAGGGTEPAGLSLALRDPPRGPRALGAAGRAAASPLPRRGGQLAPPPAPVPPPRSPEHHLPRRGTRAEDGAQVPWGSFSVCFFIVNSRGWLFGGLKTSASVSHASDYPS